MGTGSEGDIELVATDIGLRPAQLFDAVAIEGHGRCAVAGADGLGVVAIGSLAGEELQGQLLLLRLLECREIPLVVEGPLFAGCPHDRQPRVVGEPEFVAVLHAPDGVLRDVLLRPSPVGGIVEGQFVGTLLFDHPAVAPQVGYGFEQPAGGGGGVGNPFFSYQTRRGCSGCGLR